MICNGLRELDRFLNVLLEASAHSVAPADFDQRGFGRRTGAPGKLNVISTLTATPPRHAPRLRAIGRLRDSLPHAGGSISLRNQGPRQGRRALAPAELRAICDFYRMLAEKVLRDVETHHAREQARAVALIR